MVFFISKLFSVKKVNSLNIVDLSGDRFWFFNSVTKSFPVSRQPFFRFAHQRNDPASVDGPDYPDHHTHYDQCAKGSFPKPMPEAPRCNQGLEQAEVGERQNNPEQVAKHVDGSDSLHQDGCRENTFLDHGPDPSFRVRAGRLLTITRKCPLHFLAETLNSCGCGPIHTSLANASWRTIAFLFTRRARPAVMSQPASILAPVRLNVTDSMPNCSKLPMRNPTAAASHSSA